MTSAAADEPMPRETGIAVVDSSENGGRVRSIRRARAFMATSVRFSWFSSRAASGPPLTTLPGSPSVSMIASFQTSSARPSVSNPGPRFADDAGALTENRIVQHLLQRVERRVDLDRTIRQRSRLVVHIREMVVDDRVRILQYIPREHPDNRGIVPALPRCDGLADAGERGGRGGLAADPGAVDDRLRVEDLVIGDGGHQATSSLDGAAGAFDTGRRADVDGGRDCVRRHRLVVI